VSGVGRIGTIVAVCVSERKGEGKRDVGEGMLLEGFGLEGDAHGGDWHRQVSLLSKASIEEMRRKGFDVGPGDFAENLTVEGLDVWGLPVGTRLRVGLNALLEVTQIGKECHTGCAVFKATGSCIMPKQGVFARVIKGGPVRKGDIVRVVDDDKE